MKWCQCNVCVHIINHFTNCVSKHICQQANGKDRGVDFHTMLSLVLIEL